MNKPRGRLRISALRHDERGATVVEYGLILALIFLAIVSGVTALGSAVQQRWNLIANSVTGA